MVYKKFGNKIPSLSSLLLAGVLLGSNCQKDKDKDKASEQPITGGVNLPGPEQGDKGGSKNFSAGYLDAVKAMFNFFVEEVSSIGHLKNKPLVAATSDLHRKEGVERLCKSFSGSHLNAYPSSIRDNLRPLEKLKFYASASVSANVKTPRALRHKFAYGSAINEIAIFFNELHSVYKEMMGLIQKGAPEAEMGQLANKLDELFGKAKQTFIPSRKFHDSTKCTLPLDDNGAQFIRFLTDTKPDGKEKENKRKMPELMKDEVDNVWIQGIYGEKPNGPDEAAGRIDPSRTASIDNIQTRGAGMLQDWTVKHKCKMMEVKPFPNAGLLYDCKIDSASCGVECGPLDSDYDPNKRAPILATLSFAQFLFTLFKGNQKYDFINLSPDTEDGDSFKLEGYQDKFELVKDAACDSSDPEKFAKILGEHIENPSTGLNELFVIPDLGNIRRLILRNIDVNDNQPANLRGQESPEAVGRGSILHALLENFTGILGVRKTEPAQALKVCEEFVNKHKQGEFMPSTASIEQKICVKVLAKMFEETGALEDDKKPQDGKHLTFSKTSGTAKTLIEWIKRLLKQEVDNAVVYKEDGAYRSTRISTAIQQWMKDMAGKLSEKHNAASVTYEVIKKNAPGFDINEISKAMESDYQSIKAILTTKVDPVLKIESAKGTVDYRAFFPNLKLIDAHTEPLDEIRLAYVNKKQAK